MKATYWQLMDAMKNGKPLGVLAIVNSIEREDGSGHFFNVKGYRITDKKPFTIFVQTDD